MRQQTPAAVVPIPLEVSAIRGSIVNLQKELPEIRFRREKARKTLADLKFKLIEAKMNGNETDKKISSIVGNYKYFFSVFFFFSSFIIFLAVLFISSS